MKIISMEELLASSSLEILNNKRFCVLTFDDGYENVYQHGLPVLKELNCPATIFLLGHKISGINDWDPLDSTGQCPDRLLSMSQIKAMADTGLIRYGSHGLCHKKLTETDVNTTRSEIIESYLILSKLLSKWFLPVFAFPWGEYSDSSLEVLLHSKYLYAFTTDQGLFTSDSPRFKLPRYSIDFRFSNPFFMLIKLMQYKIGIFDFAFDLGRVLRAFNRETNVLPKNVSKGK